MSAGPLVASVATDPGSPLGWLLGPRDPRDRPVNRTAEMAGVGALEIASGYVLAVDGRVERPLRLSELF